MISKALFREQIKVQFYLYTILLFLYQIYDGLYGLYHIDPKIIHHGMITDYEGTFADFKGSVINSTMVWLLAILVLVFMQFSFLRKKGKPKLFRKPSNHQTKDYYYNVSVRSYNSGRWLYTPCVCCSCT